MSLWLCLVHDIPFGAGMSFISAGIVVIQNLEFKPQIIAVYQIPLADFKNQIAVIF
jgi:hypothetical protein